VCCYTVLEIAPTATSVEIKRAFYAQARKLHPDAGGGAHAEKQFVQAVLAYETLMDRGLRRMHDKDRMQRDVAGSSDRRTRRRPRRPGGTSHSRWRAEEGDEMYSHANGSIATADERLFLSLDRAMLHAFEGEFFYVPLHFTRILLTI
jgi:curved DNA-binding protein CbpA